MKKIWVYAEETQEEVNKVTLELLGKAGDLAKTYRDDVEIAAVLLTGKLGSKIKILEAYGANKIYAGEDERLEAYCHTTYAPVIAKIIEKEEPDIFLFGATQTGSELAPTVAAIVKTGVAAHCIDMRINDEGLLVADVPAFGGKIIGEILIPRSRPQMASVKPGIFQAEEADPGKAVVEMIDLQILEKADPRLIPLGTHVVASTEKPIDQAEIIVAGGYGLGSAENWEKIKELAELLGGAAGATRPCVDEGWAENEQIMIGTSGKSVKPKVYVGFGISGATHHICGMKDSGLIISVNRDENASIFGVSNYYSISDAGAILPVLIDLVKNVKHSGDINTEVEKCQ
jgi:electron transfer flavoprotein alpha subunit